MRQATPVLPAASPAWLLFPAPAAGAAARHAAAPAYYAYTVGGDIYNYLSHGTQHSASVPGRYLKIRATATGRLLARITPPTPSNDFSLLTSDADGRLYIFGAMRYWHQSGRSSSWLRQRDQRTPMMFQALRIAAGGRLQMVAVPLPEPLWNQRAELITVLGSSYLA